MNALDYLQTPCGVLAINANQIGVTSVIFVEHTDQQTHANQHTDMAKAQLTEYLQGKRTRFNLSLAAQGTEFQMRVWQALQSIDFAATASYLDIANAVGNPKACRAVGAANGRNPISIIVPCHRIIGNNGKLTGYAGGLNRKQWLLEHEKSAKG